MEHSTFTGVKYRTCDGSNDFIFTFCWIEGQCSWRIYIDSQPSYDRRSISAHATHRLVDEAGTYVCWAGRISSIHEAKHVAALWADSTQRYISSGLFQPPIGRTSEITDRSVIATKPR